MRTQFSSRPMQPLKPFHWVVISLDHLDGCFSACHLFTIQNIHELKEEAQLIHAYG
jgi:hypothetical protein